MTVSLQRPTSQNLDLTLTVYRDVLPLTYGSLPNPEGASEGRLSSVMFNRFCFRHGELSMACHTEGFKNTIPCLAYAFFMDETLPDIAKRILEAMAEQGFDRPVDLARAVNVSKQTVGDWIKGRTTNIRPDHLVRLADVLRVEIRWLAVGKGPRRARSPTPPDVIEATDILAVMPPEQRNAYLTILKSSKAA